MITELSELFLYYWDTRALIFYWQKLKQNGGEVCRSTVRFKINGGTSKILKKLLSGGGRGQNKRGVGNKIEKKRNEIRIILKHYKICSTSVFLVY